MPVKGHEKKEKAMNALCTILKASAGIACMTTAVAAQPNFVFILVDDMGWTGTSQVSDGRLPKSRSDFYRTPNLEILAKNGTYFSNAYAPAPMCTPSRAAYLTGKSPAQLHMTSPGRAGKAQAWQKVVPPNHLNSLPTSEMTIGEILKTKGYATAHFGKWHLGGGGPGKHGFDVHDGETGNDGPSTALNPKDVFGITTRAAKFMKKQVAAKRPFYVQLSHYALHNPTAALDASKTSFANRPKGERHTNADYAAMTKDFDTSVGLVMQQITALGISDNTYVVFTSDNGAGGRPGSRENEPLAGGKASLWEGGIRVPMIISGPKVPKNKCRHDVVVGQDLFSTFCELAGVNHLPKGVEGTSLKPLLSFEKTLFKRPGGYLVFHFPHYGKGPKQKPQSSIRKGDYKLLKDYESDTVKLFNLKADIGETKDLVKQEPKRTKELETLMADYLKRIKAQMPSKNPDYDTNAERTTGGKKGREKKGFASRFDKDGDGKVSKDEFSGPSRRFDKLDANRDGVLSGDEIPTGPPARKR